MPSLDIHLRDVTVADLPSLYQFQLDPEATRMAAFPSRDWAAFSAHWLTILGDERIVKQTIVVDGQVAGNLVCFEHQSKREVGYWLGRDYWGQGVATRALREFLGGHVTERPLYAGVAKHNVGSLRVLEKCGFMRADDDTTAPHLDDGIAEVLLVLDV